MQIFEQGSLSHWKISLGLRSNKKVENHCRRTSCAREISVRDDPYVGPMENEIGWPPPHWLPLSPSGSYVSSVSSIVHLLHSGQGLHPLPYLLVNCYKICNKVHCRQSDEIFKSNAENTVIKVQPSETAKTETHANMRRKCISQKVQLSLNLALAISKENAIYLGGFPINFRSVQHTYKSYSFRSVQHTYKSYSYL